MNAARRLTEREGPYAGMPMRAGRVSTVMGRLLFHGNLERPSSFSFVNRRLIAGLRTRSWRVTRCALDGAGTGPRTRARPDLYLFHGHPYDPRTAPAAVNVFWLTYDYQRFLREDETLRRRLNGWFDLLLVPSRFVARSCRASGVQIPIEVCAYGFDPHEMHPEVKPVPWPSRARTRFLYLGGATERKGLDVLLEAFATEFVAADPVSLLLKTFSYEHLSGWFAAIRDRYGVGQPGCPEVVVDDRLVRSVAGYYTAADVGVFPSRGEGFGLPVLECLAAGTPVMVTTGGGPMDFCRDPAVRFIRARSVWRDGKRQQEPDVGHLRRLLRDAHERARLATVERRRVAASVEAFTWDRMVEQVDQVLRARLGSKSAGRKTGRGTRTGARGGRRASGAAPRVGFAHARRGHVSWQVSVARFDAVLRRRVPGYLPVSFEARRPVVPPPIVLGQSDYCLELFAASARQHPNGRRVLYRESAPLVANLDATNRERRLCGVPEKTLPPMSYWRYREECRLADRIMLFSQTSRRAFQAAGVPDERLRVITPGFDLPAGRPSRGPLRRRPRFLFVGTEPFRKGLRLLLEAWQRLGTRCAELECVMAAEAFTSPMLLAHLVRRPDIRCHQLMSRRAFVRRYREVDCLVLPSLDEGFPRVVADGMARGIPAIVSTTAGINDVIVSGENGWVAESGSVEALVEALTRVLERPSRLRAAGAAAYDTARTHPWSRCEPELLECLLG